MATVTLGGSVTWNTTGGDTTVTTTPAVDELIVVVAASSGLAGGTTAVSDNQGGTYVQVDSDRTGFSTTGVLTVWVRTALIPRATSTIFTASQASSTGGGLAVLRVTGMANVGAAAVRSNGGQSTGTLGTTPAPVLSLTPLAQNPIISVVCNGATAASMTVRSSPAYGEDFDNGYSTPGTGMCVSHINSGETSATITWGSTSATAFASVAIELDTTAAPTVVRRAPGPYRDIAPRELPPPSLYSVAVTDNVRAVDDVIAVTDSVASAKTIPKALADSVVLADSLTRVVTYARSVADGVILADQAVDDQGLRLGDAVSLTDNLTSDNAAATATFIPRSVGPWRVINPRVIPVARDTGIAATTNYTVTVDDSVSLADARTFTRGILTADGVVLVDQTIDSQGIRVGDTLTLSDSLARAVAAARTLTDSVTLSDSLTSAKTIPKALADTLTLSDARAISQGEAIADTVSLSDSASPVITKTASVSDTVTLSDARTFAFGKAVADSVTLADSSTRVKTIALSISDSVVLADARVYSRGIAVADGVVLVDQTIDSQGIRVGDTITLSDSFSRVNTSARTITDSVVLSDARAFAQGEALADSVALTDSLSTQQFTGTPTFVQRSVGPLRKIAPRARPAAALASGIIAVGHTVSISDSVELAWSVTIAWEQSTGDDTIVISDTPGRVVTYNRTTTDSVALADSEVEGRGKGVADAVALADSFSRLATYLRSVADAVALTDAISPNKTGAGTVSQSDVVALADLLSRVSVSLRSVTDSVTVSDSLSKLLSKTVTVSDSVSLSDSFTRVATYVRTPADVVALTDAFVSAHPRTLNISDLVSLTDAQNVFNGVVTVLLDAVHTGHIGMGWTGGVGDNERVPPLKSGGENGHIAPVTGGELALTAAGVHEEDDQE